MLEDEGVTDLGEAGLKTGIAPKSAPEAWLYSMLNGFNRFDILMMNLNGPTDQRPYWYVRNLIIKIPEDDIRIDLLKRLDTEIRKINALDVKNEVKGELKILAAQNAAGEVIAYADEYIGIANTIIIAKV
ncbi:MAG: hypothetical protein WC683_11830 [bacterium]